MGQRNVISIVIITMLITTTPAMGEETTTELEQGKAMLKMMRNPPDSFFSTYYFEAKMDNWTAGYSRISFNKLKKTGTTIYEMVYDFTLDLTGYAHMVGHVRHLLSTTFSPLSSEVEMILKVIDGSRVEVTSLARYDGGVVKFTIKERGGTKVTEKEMPIPAEPFVADFDFLLLNAQPEKLPAFALHSLDFEEGTPITYHFSSKKLSVGNTRIDIVDQDRNFLGYYLFGKDDKLIKFGFVNPKPHAFKLVDKVTFDKLVEQYKYIDQPLD